MTVRQFILSGANTGTWGKWGSSWADSHDAASAPTGFLTGTGWGIGPFGRGSASNWMTVRMALTIPTTALPADAVISASRIKTVLYLAYLTGIADPTTFAIRLVQGNHQVPPIDSDYGAMISQVVKGVVVSQLADAHPPAILVTLDATTRAWITKAGNTKFGIRANFDIDNVAPDGRCSMAIGNISSLAKATPSAATGITATSATLNGTANGLDYLMLEVTYTSITEDPTTVRPRYKFQYQKVGVVVWTDCAWQYNKAAGASISQAIVGLLPLSLYFFRIVSDNEQGQYTSPSLSFTTQAALAPLIINKAYALAREEL